MSIDRDGWNGPIIFTCDVCDETFETGEEDFKSAHAMAKAKGWRTKKIGDEWINYCCKECMEDK